jgi:predicted ATPase
MITRLAISGYRSLRDLNLELKRLNVVCGANGVGKSSLYRAVRLLADIAQGRIIHSLATEGGLGSTLWAGPEAFSRGMKQGTQRVEGLRRKDSVSLKLGFASEDYGYCIDLGLPVQNPPSKFLGDPVIKAESLWLGPLLTRSGELASRKGRSVRLRDESGAWREAYSGMASFDSMMTYCADPRSGLELLLLREKMREWRFYDSFRTDSHAPARRRQIGTFTPILASDGRDLAAALQTIIEIGAEDELGQAIDDAFPGSSLDVTVDEGYFDIVMRQHGLLRGLRAAELSDGTLRYLLLVAALLSPRPPAFMVLNEPETSLHPDLLGPLSRMIAKAMKNSQILVITHSRELASAMRNEADGKLLMLEKQLGETIVCDNQSPKWVWPARS